MASLALTPRGNLLFTAEDGNFQPPPRSRSSNASRPRQASFVKTRNREARMRTIDVCSSLRLLSDAEGNHAC
jgi:hypothetical protein